MSVLGGWNSKSKHVPSSKALEICCHFSSQTQRLSLTHTSLSRRKTLHVQVPSRPVGALVYNSALSFWPNETIPSLGDAKSSCMFLCWATVGTGTNRICHDTVGPMLEK
uniref:Uncharacterized protein n=1 Tax=Anguilla anguilla TaxID=7936 RepID=A0A0E9XJE0_ANGAN